MIEQQPANDLFDYAESVARKNEGMALTLDAQAVDWGALYDVWAERWLNDQPPGSTFIGEDVRRFLLGKIGSPKSPNSWGAKFSGVFKRMSKEGRVRVIGMSAMTGTKSHARLSPLYEVIG